MNKIHEIINYLKDKGIEHRIEDSETIALKHCLFGKHKENWNVAIIFEESPSGEGKKWYYFCFDSCSGMLFTEFKRICDHEIDAIRS